ncbi:Mo-dependent nitrogenase C-terminal domain-containing protein [Nostoc sp. WHI]|uniref:Mo-dependent nitrogenase C-terminal domain-containing protein n=1 Tax=Nostoc sp. WHI TaxID=2650611 RepID=UPI0018C6926D|nr:Mo-dependent nitrogenase C-terminal domain-containing protein [Nostoc sp. WHI]MBG1266895.1 nitrogenase [Nostoc sp. WHI]
MSSFVQARLPKDLLHPVREWLETIEINNSKLAHFLCKSIPAQCPFERDITLFGRKLLHIPPMCKLNPLYEEVVGLRFRALCYLADECGEDVTAYC